MCVITVGRAGLAARFPAADCVLPPACSVEFAGYGAPDARGTPPLTGLAAGVLPILAANLFRTAPSRSQIAADPALAAPLPSRRIPGVTPSAARTAPYRRRRELMG